LDDESIDSWSNIISELGEHNRLKEEQDEIIWNKNENVGSYSTKLDYEVMMFVKGQESS